MCVRIYIYNFQERTRHRLELEAAKHGDRSLQGAEEAAGRPRVEQKPGLLTWNLN